MSGFYATIARYYDAEHGDKTDDIEMYQRIAEKQGGPIFEVACGTGRIMFHLAEAGYEVHGIDIEPAMLERAHRRLEQAPHLKDRLVFIEGDVLKLKPEQRYKLVIFPYGGMSHFHEQQTQIDLLRRLRSMLTDDGLLVLDLRNPADVHAERDTDAVTLEKTFIEPETGHLLMQFYTSRYDPLQQLLHLTWIYDEVTDDGTIQRTVAPVTYRHYSYFEIQLLLMMTGFRVEGIYGDGDERPLEASCERMIVFARPV